MYIKNKDIKKRLYKKKIILEKNIEKKIFEKNDYIGKILYSQEIIQEKKYKKLDILKKKAK